MNNLIKVTGISIILLSAVYAAFTLDLSDQQSEVKPSPKENNHISVPELADPQQVIARDAQQKILAPPSIDKPNVKNLQDRAPQPELNRMPPPPPMAPVTTADTQHRQDRGHGHEHQESDNNNSQPPPQGVNL